MNEKLLNCEALAKALKRAPNYVTAMRRAGYVFKYEPLRETTLDHARAVLESHPGFIANHYLKPGWKRLPKCLAAPKSRTV